MIEQLNTQNEIRKIREKYSLYTLHDPLMIYDFFYDIGTIDIESAFGDQCICIN